MILFRLLISILLVRIAQRTFRQSADGSVGSKQISLKMACRWNNPGPLALSGLVKPSE